MRNLAPQVADLLDDFCYEPIWRVSLGCQVDALPPSFEDKLDAGLRFVLSTDSPGRVPDSQHRLLQVGLRAAHDQASEAQIRDAVALLGLRAPPIVARADHWPESDLDSRYDAAHKDSVRAVTSMLPAGLSLVGSDYCLDAPTADGIARLNGRLSMGRAAARSAETCLKARRR